MNDNNQPDSAPVILENISIDNFDESKKIPSAPNESSGTVTQTNFVIDHQTVKLANIRKWVLMALIILLLTDFTVVYKDYKLKEFWPS